MDQSGRKRTECTKQFHHGIRLTVHRSAALPADQGKSQSDPAGNPTTATTLRQESNPRRQTYPQSERFRTSMAHAASGRWRSSNRHVLPEHMDWGAFSPSLPSASDGNRRFRSIAPSELDWELNTPNEGRFETGRTSQGRSSRRYDR